MSNQAGKAPGFGLAIGVGVGAAMGIALGNIAIGVGLGAAFGLIFYPALVQAKKDKGDDGGT